MHKACSHMTYLVGKGYLIHGLWDPFICRKKKLWTFGLMLVLTVYSYMLRLENQQSCYLNIHITGMVAHIIWYAWPACHQVQTRLTTWNININKTHFQWLWANRHLNINCPKHPCRWFGRRHNYTSVGVDKWLGWLRPKELLTVQFRTKNLQFLQHHSRTLIFAYLQMSNIKRTLIPKLKCSSSRRAILRSQVLSR